MNKTSCWNSLIDEVIPIRHPANQSVDYIRQVLPDSSPNLIWLWQGDLAVEESGQWEALSTLSLSGLLMSKKQYATSAQAQGVVVKLRPWTLGLLKDHSATESINQSIRLPNDYAPAFPSPMSEPSIAAQTSASWLQPIFDHYFSVKTIDQSIIKAIQCIERSQPGPRIKVLAEQASRCSRQFERRFKTMTGLTPKQFVRNVRFERARNQLVLGHSLLDVTYACGYFDQTHFTREFKQITGMTPGTFRQYKMSLFY